MTSVTFVYSLTQLLACSLLGWLVPIFPRRISLLEVRMSYRLVSSNMSQCYSWRCCGAWRMLSKWPYKAGDLWWGELSINAPVSRQTGLSISCTHVRYQHSIHLSLQQYRLLGVVPRMTSVYGRPIYFVFDSWLKITIFDYRLAAEGEKILHVTLTIGRISRVSAGNG